MARTPGVIDKFYWQALAAAIGFTPVMDPVLELFAGEHAHMEFTATSAEDSFFVTAQGMDFSDDWSYQLIGPDGHVVYADGSLLRHGHGHGAAHADRHPQATARRRHGSLRSSFSATPPMTPRGSTPGALGLLARQDRRCDGGTRSGRADFPRRCRTGPRPRYSRLLTKVENRNPRARSPPSRAIVWTSVPPQRTATTRRPAPSRSTCTPEPV